MVAAADTVATNDTEAKCTAASGNWTAAVAAISALTDLSTQTSQADLALITWKKWTNKLKLTTATTNETATNNY